MVLPFHNANPDPSNLYLGERPLTPMLSVVNRRGFCGAL